MFRNRNLPFQSAWPLDSEERDRRRPHRNPTSPPPGPLPQASHGHDGILRHTLALLLK